MTNENKRSDNAVVYSIHEVAKMLRVSPNYVYTLIRNGSLPAIKLKSVKVLKSSFDKFLTDNEGKDLSDLNNIVPLNVSEIKG